MKHTPKNSKNIENNECILLSLPANEQSLCEIEQMLSPENTVNSLRVA
jgi:hypothetical protein